MESDFIEIQESCYISGMLTMAHVAVDLGGKTSSVTVQLNIDIVGATY